MIPAISGAVGPLGASEWSVGSLGGDASTGASAATGSGAIGGDSTAGATPTGDSSGSFGGALTDAINSLEQTQASATTASQQLATGQLSDPTQAITAVENASLAMDLASQIQTKVDTALTNVFQTQL